MPDREKVIKGLTAIQDEAYDRWVHRQYIEDPLITLIRDNIPDALALLREQEKTKVIFRQYDGSVESECGNCGLYLDKTYSVCPKCGKELDWNA